MSSQISVFDSSQGQDKFLKAYNLLMATWSVPFEDKWVDTCFGKTHVVVSGPLDGEPLVLLSGAQATSGMWGPMVPELTKKRRVFCIDLIDQVGLSVPTKVLKNTQDSNAWLEETLAGLGLNEVSIIGNSLGSFIASMFAVTHPDRVRKLILTAPAATVSSVSFLYIVKAIFSSSVSSLFVKKRFLQQCAAGLVDGDNKLYQVLLNAMTESKIISKIIPRKLTIDELRNLKSPTLVMLGAEDISAGEW
ncbi:alpha/beta fold hydrolase [Psychrobium sp. 1_MG-2023]|uniref:alpha/beta fold hydrolase n=1 Tax=Psychrobium sp. 1_MG-2023 TaxID=3062624 RepID=UPI0027356AB3|nr:alpha/beta hydrolase [Psychrobium sp. 1_MG-2023]MDP2562936.1 alpha/beta hydrolase [Psychrobium sp. 1_MG-2023]